MSVMFEETAVWGLVQRDTQRNPKVGGAVWEGVPFLRAVWMCESCSALRDEGLFQSNCFLWGGLTA